MNKIRKYMPEYLGVIAATLALFIWYFSSLAIEEKIIPKYFAIIIESLTVIAAAFFGSFSAFQLNNYREKESVRSKEILSLKTALFILARQANTLGNEKKELKKYENIKERCFYLPSKVGAIYTDLKIDLTSLSFLLDHSDNNLLFDIAIEQDRFSAALESINLRSEYHYTYFQTALKSSKINISTAKYADYVNAVGVGIADGIKNSTDLTYHHVYETLHSLNIMQKRLGLIAKELYPNEQFMLAQTNV